MRKTAANVEMQGIEFQIVNDSTEASKGLDELGEALKRLKSNLGGAGTSLNKAAAGITSIKNALNKMNTGNFESQLQRISKGLEALNTKTAGLKISSSIGNQLREIGSSLNAMPDTAQSKLNSLAEGLKPLGELGKQQIGPFLTQLKKLPDIINDLQAADIDKFTQQMKDLAAAMKPFADEMQKVSNGFSAFPSRIQRLVKSTEQYNGTVKKATSATNSWKMALGGLSFYKLAKMVAEIIHDSSEWEGVSERFGRAFGEYAEENYKWIKRLNEEMNINIQQFMQYSSIYGTMLKSYGVVDKDVAAMAMGYTELAYDIWAGYNDIYTSFEDAAGAVRSAIAGEIEPIRKAGFVITDAQLKVTAANYGVAYSTQSATEELKSYLRYLTMVDQANAQGLVGTYASEMNTAEGLVRTLTQQVKSLAQAFGSLLMPILSKTLPYVQAFVSLVNDAVIAIAALFGVTLQKVDFGNAFGGAAGDSGAIADNMDSAAGSAKELKRYLAGFDELNVLPDQSSSGGGGSAGGGGYSGAFDVKKLWDESIFEKVNAQAEELKEKLKPILEVAAAIGSVLAAWKISSSLLTSLANMKKTLGSLKIPAFTIPASLGLFLEAIEKIINSAKDISENGITFDNSVTMLSGFAEGIGSVFLLFGKIKTSGAFMVITGLSDMVLAIKDMSVNGVDFDGIVDALEGFALGISGIGMLTGNTQMAGISLALKGLLGVIQDIKAIQAEGFTYDNTFDLIKDALIGVGGVLLLLKGGQLASGLGAGKNMAKVATDVGDVAIGTESINSSMGTMTAKLTDLAKNMGLGVLILTEVAAGAIIFAGAIAIVGWELDKVGQAWQPVIDNAATVATAVGIGTVLMVAIGAACYGLGTLGKTVALNIGIGAAILVELGVATGLFIVEIWAIGKGLDEIGQAWQPVLDNSETITTAIEVGTGLLVGIGVVTAALGAATVASAGALPLAIGLGTAILVELAAAFIAFTESLVAVSNELTDNLAPAFDRLNPKIPGITTATENFTDLISVLATEISDYTSSMGSITWDSIVSGFQKLFAKSPIKSFAGEVERIGNDTDALNGKLTTANTELEEAITLLTSYTEFMGEMENLTNNASSFSLSTSIFTNLKEAGANLVTGFSDGMDSEAGRLNSSLNSILSTQNSFSISFLNGWNSLWSNASSSLVGYWNNILGNMSAGLNSIIYSVNNIIASVNALMYTLGYTGGISAIPAVSVQAYATGGFPETGQLFIAREAGAEMVGSIGGRTAVANNDQIETALENAAYRGVRAAMSEGGGSNGGGQTRVIVATVDGRVLFETLVDEARSDTVRTGYNRLVEA